jgi:peptide/nickel transport system substrate-binding protein
MKETTMVISSERGSRRRVAIALAVVLAAAALFGTAQAQTRGGTLTVARPADVNLWDPKYTNDNDSLWAQGQIFANLLQNSPDGTETLPWLAESFTINEDSSVYTFNLRQDAQFCDGSAITAEDVKFSFDRATEPDSGVSWQFPSDPQVEVIDTHTVRITLSRPNVAFASYLTLWGSSIVSKAHAERIGIEAMSENPLGSGPFCLDSWTKGSEVVLTPNPGYWDAERPYVDRVVLRVVQDDNARLLQVRTGAVDIALAIPFSLARALEGVNGVTTHMQTIFGSAALVPNLRTVPAFTDVRVRKAMSMAVDREAMVDALLFGNGVPAQSPFYGPGILFWTDEFAVPYDLDAARALLAETPYASGFSATLILPSGDQLAQQTATIFADQMARLGIDIRISPVEAGTWWEMWSGGEFELVYKLGTNDVLDPAMNIPFDFWSKAEGGSDSAFSGYRNEDIVRISMEAEAELDPAVRTEMYRELQRIAMEESPQFYLFHPTTIWATRDNVRGFAVFPTKAHRFWETWVEGR